MANGLTGDYDAVVEVAIATVNRLLASIHQKGVGPNVSPKFPHSLTARVGDAPKKPKYQLAESFLDEHFGAGAVDLGTVSSTTLAAVQDNVLSVQSAVDHLVASLADVQVAGTPTLDEEAGSPVALWRELPGVQGTAKIQMGAPTISVTHGATAEVTAHAQIRALYLPDPGSLPLPAPIHGEVRATFTVKITTGQDAPEIKVKPSDDNSKIAFIPAAGTPAIGSLSKAAQVARLSSQIRRFLRTKFDDIATALPESFPFRQFKGLEAGSKEAIALPVMLSGQHIPALALNSVTDLFMNATDDFAIAIGVHYVTTLMKPALKPIEEFHAGQKITGLGITLTAYSADVSNATIALEAGALVLAVFGKVKVWGALISDDEYDFTVKQRFALKLDSASQVVSLQTSGGLSIVGLPKKIRDMAKSKIETARDNAVAAAQPMVQKALKDRRTALNEALKRFDGAANAKFTSVEIKPGGIVLRGDVSLSARPSAVADVAELAGGAALTAFKSWIPGGSISRFNWSWLKPTGEVSRFPWEGVETKIVTDPHRFTFAVGGPGQPQPGQRVCLEIEGKQDGALSEVTGGEVCHVDPPWWVGAVTGVSSALAKILLVPVWGPDPGPEGNLESAIVAHLNLATKSSVVSQAGIPGIVHFAAGTVEKPLAILGEAVFRSLHQDKPIPVVVVLPRGSFAKPRRSVEDRLGALTRNLPGPLLITEDYQEEWSRAFGAGDSATFVIRSSGDHLWRSAGLDRGALTSALDGLQIRQRSRDARPAAVTVRSGEGVPDQLFADDTVPALMELRGQKALLVFWKSWSAPCIKELRRLQEISRRGGSQEATILAIGDGESGEKVIEIGRKHDLGFVLVPDPERRISSLFRINCWPTTVSINEDARIERVHLGITSKRSAG